MSRGCSHQQRKHDRDELAGARAAKAIFEPASAALRKKLCTGCPFWALDRAAFGAKRANQWSTDSQKWPPTAACCACSTPSAPAWRAVIGGTQRDKRRLVRSTINAFPDELIDGLRVGFAARGFHRLPDEPPDRLRISFGIGNLVRVLGEGFLCESLWRTNVADLQAHHESYRADRDESCSGITLKLRGLSSRCQISHIVK